MKSETKDYAWANQKTIGISGYFCGYFALNIIAILLSVYKSLYYVYLTFECQATDSFASTLKLEQMYWETH